MHNASTLKVPALKHKDLRAYGGVEVLNECEWSASLSSSLHLGNKSQLPIWSRGLYEPQNRSGRSGEVPLPELESLSYIQYEISLLIRVLPYSGYNLPDCL
jgi:hypothetical protein